MHNFICTTNDFVFSPAQVHEVENHGNVNSQTSCKFIMLKLRVCEVVPQCFKPRNSVFHITSDFTSLL